MAIIIRCFESLLSLVRTTLPVSRALAKLQSCRKENEGEKADDTFAGLRDELYYMHMKDFWHGFVIT